MENQENKFIIIDFDKNNIPLPTESKNTSDNTYVTWGSNNQYPSFLLSLYGDSAIHSAIINQKTNYIIGGGLQVEGKVLDFEINASDNINEFTAKIIKDYLIFNAFAVEVVFNSFNEPIEFFHVPMHKLRMNKSKNNFFYSEDWYLSKKYINYNRYSTINNSDSTSKIFFYDGYFPSLNNIYPTPEYNGSIRAITTDIAISEFNLNNIKNSFSPSNIITFFNGENVSKESKEETIRLLERSYKGETGKRFLIDFQQSTGKPAEIKPLSVGDWDKAYVEVNKNNIDNIMVGHTTINSSLFGIQTAGKLGNTQEIETSYEMFKASYVLVKRREIETALNKLFTHFQPIQGRVTFNDKPLFQTRLDDVTKVKIFTINELRALQNLPPITDGERLLGEVTTTSTTITPTTNVTPDAPIEQEDVKKKPSSKKLTDEDFELIKDLGASFEEFDIIEHIKHHQFDKESDIARWIIENDIKGVTASELVNILSNEASISISEDELKNVLKSLNDSGVLKVDTDSSGKIKVTPNEMPDIPNTDSVFTMYKYIKRPEMSGDDLITNSRGFCVKLINNNRLYTREEIQSMGSIFGYDVYRFAGGWYHNPETNETTSHCRHQWQALKVKRKN